MKSPIYAVVAVAFAVPALAFAQANVPLTRAQVRAELVQLEKAGYRPGDGDHTTYPVKIQAAEAKIAAQNNAVGGAADDSSETGGPSAAQPASAKVMKATYFGR